MNNLNDLADSFEGARILLVGDIMLDTFVYGGVSRISPEGPIPVLSVSREDKMLGGAGNVFANLRALGCEVDVVSVVGQDAAGREIMDTVEDKGSITKGFVIDDNRPTILKTRYISQGQQLLRVDRENAADINQTLEQKIIDYVAGIISDINILVLSDYGKGTRNAFPDKRSDKAG